MIRLWHWLRAFLAGKPDTRTEAEKQEDQAW